MYYSGIRDTQLAASAENESLVEYPDDWKEKETTRRRSELAVGTLGT